MNDDDMEGHRVVVTGGTRGIGAAVVRRLRAGGARVAAVARHERPVPPGVHLVTADLSTPGGVSDAAAGALDALGGLDAVVNNAGANAQVPEGPLAATDDQWAANLDSNLMAAVRLDRALVPVLTSQGHGSVVHVSSGSARYPQPNGVPYAAAKAALNAYSKGLANAVGSSGVRVTVVMPGYIETDTLLAAMQRQAARSGRDVDALRTEALERLRPALGRPGTADETAELIAFLVSPRASYLSGTQIAVDGGLLPTL